MKNESKVVEYLQQISDEADHILGTEADDPLAVARQNASVIKRLVIRTLDALTAESKARIVKMDEMTNMLKKIGNVIED